MRLHPIYSINVIWGDILKGRERQVCTDGGPVASGSRAWFLGRGTENKHGPFWTRWFVG